jgi:hypothetical protein
MLFAMLPVQPICVLADNTVSLPNPVGEAVYRPHLIFDMIPLAVIVFVLLLAWLLHAVKRKANKLAPNGYHSSQ